jgi:DNA-binding GntR family transcriptional regulator
MAKRTRLQSTSSILAERLREDILQGVYVPGDFLPQEEIAVGYGVSRSPFREALRQLEAEGWVIYHRNRGAFVAAISAKDVRQLYQVRRILESGAIRLAAQLVDPHQLRVLRNLNRALQKASDYRKAVVLHQEFHQTLYAAVGNPKLLEAIARHHVRAQRLPLASKRIDAMVRRTRADHRAILAACERHDPRAAESAILEELSHLETIMIEGLE